MTTMTTKDRVNHFAQYMQGRVSDSTLHIYVSNLNQFLRTIDGYELTPDIAQIYLDALKKAGKSPSTVSVRAYAIMGYFESIKQQVHLDCPAIRMKPPEYKKIEEVRQIISCCQTQLEKTLLIVLFDTAVRISELLNLQLSDIDFKYKMITVTRKGNRRQEVNISDKALDEIKNWLSIRVGDSESVFNGLNYQSARKIIMGVGIRAGIPIHAHLFRHSRAIQMLRGGVELNVVSQHLGHVHISTTSDIYGQFTAVDLKDKIISW